MGGHPDFHFLRKAKMTEQKNFLKMGKRKTYCTNLNADLMKEIRVLSARQVRRQNDLLEEAIKDLLIKYKLLEPSLGISSR
jgi:hypothetical protein